MQSEIEKAKILIESLPYIRKFSNQTIVIKYGGHAMRDEGLKKSFALDIILMQYVGLVPIVVHGGGPQIGRVLEKMGIKSSFHKGMRVTDSETMEVVEMVLVGKVNKDIVGLINQHGGRSVGLCGKDGGLIQAKKLSSSTEIEDMGMVGQVELINPSILETLKNKHFIPVIAPVGVGPHGETYNINADLVAGKIASATKAKKLILLTDVEGINDDKGKLIPSLSTGEAQYMVDKGLISGGMIPKVNCCIEALKEGVEKAHIIDGRIEHAILLEIFTDKGIGTEIVA
ncbi:MAG TPA: acetylglutamate kinase [Syntrophaceae bacterium]|nr:acetylglutamate kinase [Syntrophaceae bacterium]